MRRQVFIGGRETSDVCQSLTFQAHKVYICRNSKACTLGILQATQQLLLCAAQTQVKSIRSGFSLGPHCDVSTTSEDCCLLNKRGRIGNASVTLCHLKQRRRKMGGSKLSFLQRISSWETPVAERRTEKNEEERRKAGLAASSKYW